MSRSPAFVPPEGTEDKALAGVAPCGCIGAAHAVRSPQGYPPITEKDIRDFYADMAKSGYAVEWRTRDEIQKKLFGACHEQHAGEEAA